MGSPADAPDDASPAGLRAALRAVQHELGLQRERWLNGRLSDHEREMARTAVHQLTWRALHLQSLLRDLEALGASR